MSNLKLVSSKHKKPDAEKDALEEQRKFCDDLDRIFLFCLAVLLVILVLAALAPAEEEKIQKPVEAGYAARGN